MDDYDDDYVIPLTRIEFEKEQRKNLKIGFIWMGIVILCLTSCGVWFFATWSCRIAARISEVLKCQNGRRASHSTSTSPNLSLTSAKSANSLTSSSVWQSAIRKRSAVKRDDATFASSPAS